MASRNALCLGKLINIPRVKMLELKRCKRHGCNRLGNGNNTFTNRKIMDYFDIGRAEVRMVDMATAFGVFANSGIELICIRFLKLPQNRQSFRTNINHH